MMNRHGIDHDNKIRLCKSCHQVKPFSEYSVNVMENGRTYLRPHCKACRSEHVSNWAMTKKARARPWLYQQCVNEECNKIFYKTKESCPNCGSKGERHDEY